MCVCVCVNYSLQQLYNSSFANRNNCLASFIIRNNLEIK